jgi:aminoglycoside phosphotransferase (APT) family kinase protein
VDRGQIDAELARGLVVAQFPHWAGLEVRPVSHGGWDNLTFHLGDELSIRLPSGDAYALQVAKEHRWLPVLAPQLPLSIPVPVAMGAPGQGYPYHWSVYRWLPGEVAAAGRIADLSEFARTLAEFLLALRQVDTAGEPGWGLHTWYRGGPLWTYDADTRAAIDALSDQVPAGVATEIWESALAAPYDGPPVWFHGDVAYGNLLVREGRLAVVLDFGTCGVGDPACDLAIAWTLFHGASREAFRTALRPDPAMWARARGWAWWKALIEYAAGRFPGSESARGPRHVIDQILDEYAESA